MQRSQEVMRDQPGRGLGVRLLTFWLVSVVDRMGLVLGLSQFQGSNLPRVRDSSLGQGWGSDWGQRQACCHQSWALCVTSQGSAQRPTVGLTKPNSTMPFLASQGHDSPRQGEKPRILLALGLGLPFALGSFGGTFLF